MKIYTKTGDKGETALYGGKRVPKDHRRIEAYGSVDELNSHLGLIIAFDEKGFTKGMLTPLQNQLFVLGADLATPRGGSKTVQRIEAADVERLEKDIDRLEGSLEPLKNFILPGGSSLGAQLHVARTVCRRAERAVVRLAKDEDIGEGPVIFLNRLSDFLFVLARAANAREHAQEIAWNPSA